MKRLFFLFFIGFTILSITSCNTLKIANVKQNLMNSVYVFDDNNYIQFKKDSFETRYEKQSYSVKVKKGITVLVIDGKVTFLNYPELPTTIEVKSVKYNYIGTL